MKKIKLGDRVKEEISGLEGIVMGITKWLHACSHVGVKPVGLNKDGKPHDLAWFDEPMVTVVERGAVKDSPVQPETGRKTGGPISDSRR